MAEFIYMRSMLSRARAWCCLVPKRSPSFANVLESTISWDGHGRRRADLAEAFFDGNEVDARSTTEAVRS
jgi:hypothetical protein